jgi:hypothetical protein
LFPHLYFSPFLDFLSNFHAGHGMTQSGSMFALAKPNLLVTLVRRAAEQGLYFHDEAKLKSYSTAFVVSLVATICHRN